MTAGADAIDWTYSVPGKCAAWAAEGDIDVDSVTGDGAAQESAHAVTAAGAV